MLEEHLQVARLTRALASHLLERATITARYLGLGVTEVRALEQLYLSGPMTLGDLGSSLALTSGSVTALVRRLQTKELVLREVDRDDRRKVWLSLRPDKVEWFLEPYQSTIAGGQMVVAGFEKGDLEKAIAFLGSYSRASTEATEMVRHQLKKRLEKGPSDD